MSVTPNEFHRALAGEADEEVRQRIFAIPAFQENGHFIGDARYQQLLRVQRPPLSPTDFEDGIRKTLLIEKLRSSLTAWLSIPDKELEQEYRRRNDKVKLAVISFAADKFRGSLKGEQVGVSRTQHHGTSDHPGAFPVKS